MSNRDILSAMNAVPPAQRTRINRAVPYREPLGDLLSPQQCAWLSDPQLQPASGGEVYRQDVRQSWSSLAAQLGSIGKGK